MILDIEPIAVNSPEFLFLALGLVALAWSRYRRLFLSALALCSLLMISTWLTVLDWGGLLLFLVPPYLVIRRIWGNPQAASAWIVLSIIIWQVLLFVFLRQYAWADGISWLDHPIAIIGISYMLFRVVHLVKEAPNFGALPFGPVMYGSYVLAFWTLLSGPIQRYEAFCQGLKTIGRPSAKDTLDAAHRGVNGMIKAFILAPVFLEASRLQALGAAGANWWDFIIVFYAYPIYLYLNFSGYTDLIIALARMCGIATMPENFNRPYLARNIQEFWTRWHMSFGTWIRHYVFTPLSKSLLSATPPIFHNAMLAVAVIITFMIVGMWHGTTSNFLVFGLMHGAAIIATAAYGKFLRAVLGKARKKRFDGNPVVHGVSVVLCFHYVAASIMLFPNKIGDVLHALQVLGGS